MKALLEKVFFFSLIFCALFALQSQKVYAALTSTEINSDIISDTTWDVTKSPYIVSGQISVASSATLIISPGVVVLFDYGSEIDVSGKLIANGTSDNKIYFTSVNDGTLNGEDLEGVDPDLIINPSAGDYEGLNILTFGSADFQNAEIRYAQTAIFVEDMFDIPNYLTVKNTKFLNNALPLYVNTNTDFIHSENEFVNNINNYIKLYGNFYGDNYNLSFDSIPYSIDSYLSARSITIDPGVTVKNSGKESIGLEAYDGSINAVGTPDKKITLDGVSLNEYSDNANTVVKNVDIKNLTNYPFSIVPISINGLGKVVIDGVDISNSDYGISISGGLDVDIKNTNINIVDNELGGTNALFSENYTDNNLFINLENIKISKNKSQGYYCGMDVYNSKITANNLIIDGTNCGIIIRRDVNLKAQNLKIKNISDFGILSDPYGLPCLDDNSCDSPSNNIEINKSEISDGKFGVINPGGSDIKIKNSGIGGSVCGYCTGEGFYDLKLLNIPQSIDLKNNWWGDKTGPHNAISNSNGKGVEISDGVDFSPWLVRDPTIPQKTPVLIVPGVLGTEISKQNSDGTTEKLWLDLAHNFIDWGDEFMDSLQFNDDLTPSVVGLILGDVVTVATGTVGNITFPLFNYSEKLISEFKNQGYTEGVDFFMFPYDWRYGVNEDNVNNLKNKINEILNETGSEKVDVVAHSTGGLLVKKYVMENPTSNNINKAVFVGVPNTGAPKAIKTLLEGDNFGNLLLADSEMKKIAKNLPVVYDLAPSAEYYKNKGSFLEVLNDSFFSYDKHDLNFDEVKKYLIDDHSFNLQAWTNAQNLHTADFDNYDMRNAGIDLYSIVGCKTGTVGKIVEVKSIFPDYYALMSVPGDSTVPLESATNLPINESNKFYALKASHGEMLSQDGIRQKIVDIFSGNNSSISSDLITQDNNKCGLNGRAISVYSPLSIDVLDSSGNHSGLMNDGVSIENNIPNADYEMMGEHKFVYLPTDNNQNYTIKIAGIGDGVFTITDANIENSTTTSMQVFNKIPVTTSLVGNINLGTSTSITLDINGDGVVDKTLKPDAFLDSTGSQNFNPENFEKKDQNTTSNSQSVSTSSGHPIFEAKNDISNKNNTVDVVVNQTVSTNTIETSKTISTNTEIRYNTINKQNSEIKDNKIAKISSELSEKDNIATSTNLSARVSESGVSVNHKILISSLCGVLLLMFAGRIIIKL